MNPIPFLRLNLLSILFLGIVCVLMPAGKALSQDEGDGKLIPTEEFVKSPAAEFFQGGDYERALEALNGLAQKYPEDPLILRYRAISLDRMGRSQEAVDMLKNYLKQEPGHVPTRFFLGEAYEHQGQKELAATEWKYVAELPDAEPYSQWATERLKILEVPEKEKSKQGIKRWVFTGRYGWEYDSNVILKPEDKSLASPRDPSAGRHIGDAVLRYRAYSRRDLAVDLIYGARQSLHDDSLDEFNFTSQEFGAGLRKRVTAFDRDFILGTRYDLLLGFLNGDIFSNRSRWTNSIESRFTSHTRTVLTYRLTASDYGPDGFDPPQTSRDGIYNDVGLTQYWYSKDFKKYLFIEEEFNSADTRGANFETRGNTTRLGIHTPLAKKTDLDVWGSLQYAHYPDFTSLSSFDREVRRDLEWEIYSGLTYYLTPRLGLRGFYRYSNAQNKNGFFEYTRHMGGVQVILTEAF